MSDTAATFGMSVAKNAADETAMQIFYFFVALMLAPVGGFLK